jgi:site-specific recombinase XerD
MPDVDTDDIADLIACLLDEGLKPNTVRNVITPLSGMFRHAVRKGLIPSNPVSLLEPYERPPRDNRDLRVLTSEEIRRTTRLRARAVLAGYAASSATECWPLWPALRYATKASTARSAVAAP